MPLDYYNPGVIKFLKHSYERENEQRNLWFLKNQEIITAKISRYNKFISKEYHKEDIARADIELLMSNCATHNQAFWYNRRRKYPLDNPIVLAPKRKKIISDEENIAEAVYSGAIMMPVDPDVKKILNIELPYGGRQEYLNKRKKVLPEEKYYFCETSSNICGWRLKDSKVGYSISEYKRKALFFRDLISRSGPHPDPPHYNDPQHFSKCIS